MTAPTELADIFEHATADATDLASWAEPNTWALQDEAVEEAVLRALAGPVPGDLAIGIPLLRFANPALEAVPLVTAVVSPPIPRGNGRTWFTCDVDGTRMREPNTLWVPCGASVVQLTVRNHVRGTLMYLTSGNLVWS